MEKKNNETLVGIIIGMIITLTVAGCLYSANILNIKTSTIEDNQKTNTTEENKTVDNANEEINKATDASIETIAKTIGEKMYKNLYSFQTSWIFCGENMKWNNKEDYIQNPKFEYEYHLYDVSQDFKSIKELNDYLKTYLTDDMIKKYYQKDSGIYEYKDGKYVNEIYLEKDGKLYCKNPNKDHGYVDYDKDNSTYNVITSTDNSAVVSATIGFKEKGDETTINADKLQYEIIKENNKWLIKSFLDIPEGMVNIRSIETYLKDITEYNKSNSNHKITVAYDGKDYTDSNMLSIIDNIDSWKVSPNGEKWRAFVVMYNNEGYISKVVIS